VDVNLSNDNYIVTALKPNVSAGQKAPTDNDTGNDGASLAKPTAPNPISSDAPKQSNPSTADQVLTIVPPADRRGRKRPPPATKWAKPITLADQVMSQVELPPYHRPCHPLDLVAIEIIFGRIFEAFRQISHVDVAGATSVDASKPMKTVRHLPLKKTLMPW
jgi:hypothetical protein